jgi:hypothetical protein
MAEEADMGCNGAAYPQRGPVGGSGFAFLCSVFAKFLQRKGVEWGTISPARFSPAFW